MVGPLGLLAFSLQHLCVSSEDTVNYDAPSHRRRTAVRRRTVESFFFIFSNVFLRFLTFCNVHL